MTEPTIDIAELTTRLGLPADQQETVQSFTGEPAGTTWAEDDAARVVIAWRLTDGGVCDPDAVERIAKLVGLLNTDAHDADITDAADAVTVGQLIRALDVPQQNRVNEAMTRTLAREVHIRKVHGGDCPHGGCDSCDLPDTHCGQRWVAEIERCYRCGLSGAEHPNS